MKSSGNSFQNLVNLEKVRKFTFLRKSEADKQPSYLSKYIRNQCKNEEETPLLM